LEVWLTLVAVLASLGPKMNKGIDIKCGKSLLLFSIITVKGFLKNIAFTFRRLVKAGH
jgi:hypothetical protein